MRKVKLGQSDLAVSEICLGSMTWGNRNTESEGHAQIDFALERGVNFIDTAEMYPVLPVRAETVGATEAVIGSWIEKTGRRDDVVIATKVSGGGHAEIRDGAPFSPQNVQQVAEGSLRRLKTDVIDIYQLHWPSRGSYHFRQNWTYDPSSHDRAQILDEMAATLDEMQKLVQAGKIRHFGLSNESAWGTAQWLRLAEASGGPRPLTIQNEYSLLCRLYDTDLAELGHNENIPLLAFSPLAAGMLSGKYAGDVIPEGSRRAFSEGMSGRCTPRVWEAISAYLRVAHKHGINPVQMAVAFVLTRPYPAIPIIGATSLEQLGEILDGDGLELSQDVLADIEAVHKAHPMPY